VVHTQQAFAGHAKLTGGGVWCTSEYGFVYGPLLAVLLAAATQLYRFRRQDKLPAGLRVGGANRLPSNAQVRPFFRLLTCLPRHHWNILSPWLPFGHTFGIFSVPGFLLATRSSEAAAEAARRTLQNIQNTPLNTYTIGNLFQNTLLNTYFIGYLIQNASLQLLACIANV
jgi:hypothetical protein